jgi:hypothetical protein
VVSFPPATVETGAMGLEIESRQGIGRKLFFKKNMFARIGTILTHLKESRIHST